MQLIFRRVSTILLLLFVIIALPLSSSSLKTQQEEKKMTTYYDVLGIVNADTCTLKDIKKAYRALALQYHPDRVPAEKKEEATIKFREVSEAYEVLSDSNSRSDYDRSLKYSGGGGSSSGGGGSDYNAGQQQHQHQQQQQQQQYYHNQHQHHRDPFSQFNDLFQNDPFFNDAFKDMDDLFAKTFQQQNNNVNNNNNMQQNQNQKKNQNQNQHQNQNQRGWGGWLLDTVVDKLGIDLQVSSSSHTNAGTSHSTTNYGRRRSSAAAAVGGTTTTRSSTSTYTSKTTKTIVENGRRITIQSMEKDGNKIEERYEGTNLVQRLVNGHPQNIGRIEQGGGGDL